jgi:hypothetical protein
MTREDAQMKIRLPADLKARIEQSATRNKRSLNGEIVQALNQLFPPEPDVDELLDKLQLALRLADHPDGPPYREPVIKAIERLAERVNAGIEFDTRKPHILSDLDLRISDKVKRIRRWERARESGVLQDDLETELEKGFLNRVGRDRAHSAIEMLAAGKPDAAMSALGLTATKWAEPAKAYAAIERWLRTFYAENWGNPDRPIPIDDD